MSSCESDSCVLSPDENVPSKIASDEDFYIIDQVGEVDQAGDNVDGDFFVVQAKLSTKDNKSQTCDIVDDGGQDVVLLDDQSAVANGKVKGDDIITLDSTLEEEGGSGDDIFILDTEPERPGKAPATPVCDEMLTDYQHLAQLNSHIVLFYFSDYRDQVECGKRGCDHTGGLQEES